MQKTDSFEYYLRFNKTGASGTPYNFETKYTVTPLPNKRHPSAYTASGFIGLMSVVNEFLNCGDSSCFKGAKYSLTGDLLNTEQETGEIFSSVA